MSFLKSLFADDEPIIEFNSTLFSKRIFGVDYIILLKGLYNTRTRKIEDPANGGFSISFQTNNRIILDSKSIESGEDFQSLFVIPMDINERVNPEMLRELDCAANLSELISRFKGTKIEINPFSYSGSLKLMFSNINVANINYEVTESILDTELPINDRIIYENSYREIPLANMDEFDFNISETFTYQRGKDTDQQLDDLIDAGYIIQDEKDADLYHLHCIYFLENTSENTRTINEDTVFVVVDTDEF